MTVEVKHLTSEELEAGAENPVPIVPACERNFPKRY